MFSLTERNCADLKDEVLEGRLTVGGMWGFLVYSFLISSIVIGVAYMAATANTVGWGTLSGRWHMFFYIEVIIFALHLLVLLSCWANNPFSQKVASIAVVVCSYRIAFEPYTVVLLVSKDRGTYDLYLPVVQVIIVCALVFHIIVFRRWVKEMKKNESSTGIFENLYLLKFLLPFPVLFFIVTFTGSLIKNGSFGNHELTFMLFIFTILTFSMLLAVCELIIASYCILRFPSFSANAPKPKKKQYVKQSKSKKKKKKR